MLGGIFLVALFLLGFVGIVFFIFQKGSLPIFRDSESLSIAPVILVLFSELIFSLGATIILYFSFRKTTSAEIFFFMGFIISISFDALKLIPILISITNSPPYLGVIASRVIYFGRYFGTAALFSAGLFSTGIGYGKMELALGIVFILAFSLALTIPIDMTSLEENLVHRSTRGREIMTIRILFQSLAVLNFILAAIMHKEYSYLFMAAGVALVFFGRELLFYVMDPILIIVAFVLVIGGSTIFSERTHEVHLWA